jgi:DNA-directed RNA polymerase specialized sigma24 family protein
MTKSTERKNYSKKSEDPNSLEIEKREFTRQAKVLIDKEDRILSVIKSLINSYNLSQNFEPKSIFNDSYLRGIAAIEKGKKIINPEAWLIKTARNIIREETRKKKFEQRTISYLKESVLEDIDYKCGEHTEEDLENIENIEAEIQKLEPLDRKIFLLRLEEKSFIEIAEQLILDGDYPRRDSLQNTVTKRFNRIKKKIRQRVLQKTD